MKVWTSSFERGSSPVVGCEHDRGVVVGLELLDERLDVQLGARVEAGSRLIQ